jgi:S-DNA-T family DNA segregation ATPase FtsK/SpoIIIE
VSSHRSISETLALLDTLRNVIRDFAAREEKLNNDFRIRSAAELKVHEEAATEQTSKAAERLSEAEEHFQKEEIRRQARYEKRKVRLNHAHHIVRKRVMDEVSGEEGHRKYKVQEGTLQAERRRDAALADSVSTLDAFNQKLGEVREGFVVLETQARKLFRGFGKFRKLLAYEKQWPEPDLSPDHNQLLTALEKLQAKSRSDIESFRKIFLPRLFRFLPLWLMILALLGLAAAVPALTRSADIASNPVALRNAAIAGAGLLVVLVLYFLGRSSAASKANAIAGDLSRARRLHDTALQKSQTWFEQEQKRIRAEFDKTVRELNQEWRSAVKQAMDKRGSRPMEIDQKALRISAKNDQRDHARAQQLERDKKETLARLQQESETAAQQLAGTHAERVARLNADIESRWNVLSQEWKNAVRPIYDAIRDANAAAAKEFPEWEIPRWEKWMPPQEFRNVAKFGHLEVNLEKFAESLPKDNRLALPGPSSLSVPLTLTYPLHGSILFEASKVGNEEAISAINNIIFRLLSTTPSGKLSFTVFDPVGLGQNFAGLMHLADYEESHINSRIWTQTNQLEEKLAELNEHMEKVIQMYLRNEYATITEYNAQAGTIAEKYHILVIASFPVNFSETAARRLRNIATSGARCGVYTLIQWDQRNIVPKDFVPDELQKNSVSLIRTEKGFELADWRPAGTKIVLDAPPSPEFATHFLHEIGKSGKDSNRVEVPFAQVAPPDAQVWTEETTEELRVPIGRSGATKFQYLEIGKGTRQHALIAGKTGSGKSTLFHVIVTNLSLWCSPEQVEFYLVDFKKGVEFKCYASRRLPHARVVAIESDRAFGLSVLQRVDEELRRRGDLFRKLGVQDVAGYKRAGGTEPMPRSLLMIDEFQEFFVEEDRISQGAAVLLDRIVRQGRAFGIHVLLGSQTLGGAYTLARATLGQMVIRIALQCNEADAYLIMDQDNPAPRLLSRPGEGIYNDAAGSIEGNSPFQAVWLSDVIRDEYLEKVRTRADQNGKSYPGPFVFEGNAPADVRENAALESLLRTDSITPAVRARIWLGAPNSIKGPTEASFQRQSGNNLLIVGQNEEASLSMLAVALVSLAAQYPPGTVRFVLLDSTVPGTSERAFLDRVVQSVPHDVIRNKSGDVSEVMGELALELKNRGSDEQAAVAPEMFVLVQGLQNFKKLRQEDEFSFSSSSDSASQPSAIFLSLISDGPGRGIHVIASCDSFNNVSRNLGRKNLSEFEMRVLFQMSASDSASLIDAPDASTLGMHRALYYNDREGYLEIFRPYAQPGNEWIERVGENLARLLIS